MSSSEYFSEAHGAEYLSDDTESLNFQEIISAMSFRSSRIWLWALLGDYANDMWNQRRNDIYEMDHIWTADMKSSEAMILAVMNAIFAIA